MRELRAFVGTTNTFYQMSVRLGPMADDDSFTTGTSGPLPRAVSGVVAPSTDIDHHQFVLSSPAQLHADLDARDGLQSLLNGTLALHGPTGLITQDDSNPDPALAVSLSAGDRTVSVEGRCSGSGCVAEDSYYVLFLDADLDGDGMVLPLDNCPLIANSAQSDGDGDGAGDGCDNCPGLFNPSQRDNDGDGQGDVCTCASPAEAGLDLLWLDQVTMGWSPSTGASSYALYRGTLDGGPFLYQHVCVAQALPSPTATDGDLPPTSTAFYYLVTGRSVCGAEGGLGFSSTGEPRPNGSPCE